MADDEFTEEEENGRVMAEIAEGTVGDVSYAEVMSNNYLLYSWSTLKGRSLPQIDGLLPVQRRILQAMRDLRLGSNARYSKCAGIVGETMKKYHPHGDMAIYGALVRMAQPFSLRVPLIDGHGNFGSIDGDGAAAPRYTEARLREPAERLMDDLHPEVLPDHYTKTFDEGHDEAEVLPSKFPNLLINGVYSISTGMTSVFLPHNPGEMIDLCMWRLENPDASPEKLVKRVKGPDFPTGGLVVDDQGLRDAYLTGKGRVTGMAKAHIETIKGGREKIVITELPWMVNKGDLLNKDIAKRAEDRYPELDSLDDFSDENIRIEATLKRGANAKAVLDRMLKHTSLKRTYPVEMNMVVDDRPKTMTLTEIVDRFLGFRRYVVVKRAEKRMREIERRLHQLDAYLKVIDRTDEVVQIIKKAKDREAAKPPLKKLLKIDDEQAQWIVSMQLGSLTRLDSQKIREEAKNLKTELKHLKKLVKTPQMITEVIAGELGDIKKNWRSEGLLERRSNIIGAEEIENSEEAGPAILSGGGEDCLLLISRHGLAACSQGTLKRGASLKLKGADRMQVVVDASTDQEYLVFSDAGKAYRMRLAELPLETRRSNGADLRSIVSMDADERVVGALPVTEEPHSILFATAQGTVKRMSSEELRNAHSGGVVAVKVADDDTLITVDTCPEGADILMVATNGKCIRFKADDVREMGRTAAGVRGMKLGADDRVIYAGTTPPAEELFVVTDTALAKRVDLTEIPVKGRAGGGVIVVKPSPNTGSPLLATSLMKGASLYIDTGSGKFKEIPVKKVTKTKRANTPKDWPGEDMALALFPFSS